MNVTRTCTFDDNLKPYSVIIDECEELLKQTAASKAKIKQILKCIKEYTASFEKIVVTDHSFRLYGKDKDGWNTNIVMSF